MQATLGTLEGYLRVTDNETLRAVYPLEGGAASQGSTCGVVSGGCMSIALGHLGDMDDGGAGKAEALYGRMRDYASWFEREFGSTICRERTGVNVNEITGFMDYLFTGKVFSRCTSPIGKAASRLIRMIDESLDGEEGATELDSRVCGSGGYCASEVLRGVREVLGYGSLFLEKLSVALDGGVGLSGGLCGALAGAMLPIGLIWGINPRETSLYGTLMSFLKGHVNLYMGRKKPELWAVATLLTSEFAARFGSMECRDVTGRSFQSGRDLADFMDGSVTCQEVKLWCRDRAVDIISHYTTFDGS
ncbi:MAG: C-GCAxxG-C-C family protein [Actinomycetota bacterium]|nr:C-GCAxxG-C-C family protein [Actinomycetota bacterium]